MTTTSKHSPFLEALDLDFKKEGIEQQFSGKLIASTSISIGEEIDEEGQPLYFMVNDKNEIVYQFKDKNQAMVIYNLVTKGI